MMTWRKCKTCGRMNKLCECNKAALPPVRSKPLLATRVVGVGRMHDYPKGLVVYFDGEPTDDDMRNAHDTLRSANAHLTGPNGPEETP